MLKNLAGLLGLSLLFVVAAYPQKPSPETELRAIYRKLDLAMRARDANKVTQYFDVNYSLKTDAKTLNRAEAVSQWKEILGFIKSVAKLSTKVEKVSAKEGNYAVDYSQSSSGKIQFPQSPVLPFTFNGKMTDTWRRGKDGKWQLVSTVEHVSDLKVKGESAKAPGT